MGLYRGDGVKKHDVEYYRKLTTSEYRGSPRFQSMVKRMAGYGAVLDVFIHKMIDAFDLETATHDQLDILGECVGITRNLNFEPSPMAKTEIICPPPHLLKLDEKPESDYTLYKTPMPHTMGGAMVISGFAPGDAADAPDVNDEVYRTLIKAKIVRNGWKGNVLDLYEMWEALFPKQTLQIQDMQDMSFNIILTGEFSRFTQELISHGYIIPKPEGVRINRITLISTDGKPIFSYKYNDADYSGYTSHWLSSSNVTGGA